MLFSVFLSMSVDSSHVRILTFISVSFFFRFTSFRGQRFRPLYFINKLISMIAAMVRHRKEREKKGEKENVFVVVVNILTFCIRNAKTVLWV